MDSQKTYLTNTACRVPSSMLANVIRQERFGAPLDAFQIEEMAVPVPKPNEVLIQVMAAGINFNNVWAASGKPVDVIAARERQGALERFHIGGSDCSGIVSAVGSDVSNVGVGDHVVTHPGWWLPGEQNGRFSTDPMLSNSARIWGYDTNYGSFAQYCIAQDHQVMPKAPNLTWEEAAASTLVGTTAYRMLHGWEGNTLAEDDVVLVWGGSGGLGTQAIQLVRAAGARSIAVVSSDERGKFCMTMGATGYINRNEFDHWGIPPHWQDDAAQRIWQKKARAFGSAFWDVLGEKKNPTIVIEHPGESTIATSAFVCDKGGMIVICAGTTGYTATVDLRNHWVHQKRLQGSHGTNDWQAYAYNRLLHEGKISAGLGKVYQFDEIGLAHQEMRDGIDVQGNRVALVGATEVGLGRGA